MKKIIYVVAIVALEGAAYAACEFPYYPEFADEFSKVEEVTPLLAKKVVMARPFICPVGAVVCEPLVVRDIAGKPLWIFVAAYRGDDLEYVDRRNAIARKLNAGERLEAADLAAEVKAYYAGDYGKALFCKGTGAYTCEDLGRLVTEGFFPPLSGYRSAYRVAASELGAEDFYFTRIIAFGDYTVQIFEFEDDAGEKTAVMVDEHRHAYPADLEENAAVMREALRRRYNWFKENPDKAELNRERRQRILPENE